VQHRCTTDGGPHTAQQHGTCVGTEWACLCTSSCPAVLQACSPTHPGQLSLSPSPQVLALVDRKQGQPVESCLLLMGLDTPNGITYDSSTGSLYVAEVTRIVRYDGVDAAALAGCKARLITSTQVIILHVLVHGGFTPPDRASSAGLPLYAPAPTATHLPLPKLPTCPVSPQGPCLPIERPQVVGSDVLPDQRSHRNRALGLGPEGKLYVTIAAPFK